MIIIWKIQKLDEKKNVNDERHSNSNVDGILIKHIYIYVYIKDEKKPVKDEKKPQSYSSDCNANIITIVNMILPEDLRTKTYDMMKVLKK